MMLSGIPTIVTGHAPYSRIGIANEPQDVKEYSRFLLGEVGLVYPSKKRTELFAYFYFIKTCIPWDLTNRSYSDNFKGFTFRTLDDIMPGRHKILDHICRCILDSDKYLPESLEEEWNDKGHEGLEQIMKARK